MSQPVLLYSLSCPWSKKLIGGLQELNLLKLFYSINVDVNKETGVRSSEFYKICKAYQIQQVPALILEDGDIIIEGERTYDWFLEQKVYVNTKHNTNHNKEIKEIKEIPKKKELTGFNIDSTSGFASLNTGTDLLKNAHDNSSSTSFLSLNEMSKTSEIWDGTTENFTDHTNIDKSNLSHDQMMAEKQREREDLDKTYSQKRAPI